MDPYKSWKLTDEDWRNRQKWDAYTQAVEEMLLKTSTLNAPWTIVEANDKYYARVKVLTTLVDLLEKGLGLANQSEKQPKKLPEKQHKVKSKKKK